MEVPLYEGLLLYLVYSGAHPLKPLALGLPSGLKTRDVYKAVRDQWHGQTKEDILTHFYPENSVTFVR